MAMEGLDFNIFNNFQILVLDFKVFGAQQMRPEELLEEECQQGPSSHRDSELLSTMEDELPGSWGPKGLSWSCFFI